MINFFKQLLYDAVRKLQTAVVINHATSGPRFARLFAMGSPAGIPFGNYSLIKRLARGGMAEVFLARQRGLEGFDRIVAIKRILPHLVDNDDFVRMFLDEARLAARLSHPHIVHIYEFGKFEEHYFIAMEYLPGVHAGDLIRAAAKEPIPEPLVARLGADACAGLHYAHQLRDDMGRPLHLVHRDISPPNLLVSHDGIVKVVDFGIAKAVNCVEKTRPGVVKGKYAYMSPEQTTGKVLDGHSDVFSLALVLWELLAGKVAIPRTDQIAAMKMIRDGKIPNLREARPGISPALANAVEMALCVNPTDRCDARSLGVALEEFIKSSDAIGSSLELSQWIETRFPRTPIVESEDGVAIKGTQQATLATPGPDAVADAIAAAGPTFEEPSRRPATHASSGSVVSDATKSGTHSEETIALGGNDALRNLAALGDWRNSSADQVLPPEHTAMGSDDFATARDQEIPPSLSAEWARASGAEYHYYPGSHGTPSYGSTTFADRVGPKLGWIVVGGLVLGILTIAAFTLSDPDVPTDSQQHRVASETALVEPEELTPTTGQTHHLPRESLPNEGKQFGGLRIDTDPLGAAIAFGNAPPSAISPATFSKVEVGEHRLVISLAGYQTVTQDITVYANDTRPVTVKLSKMPVEIRESDSRNHNENSEKLGSSSSQSAKQSNSRRVPSRIRVSSHADTRSDTLLSSKILGPRPQIEKLGTLVVRTQPYSEVFHGDRKLGQTPATIQLPPGKYVLTFKNPDLSATQRTVTITAGDTKKLSFALQ